MKRIITTGALLLSIVCGLSTMGCNTDQMHKKAPKIEGQAWVGASGTIDTPVLDERWTLVEFFAPT